MPAKFITKDETADQEIALRTQVLIDKLNDYKKKCIELRDKNLEASKQNFEKSKELEKLRLEKEHLESQLSEMNGFQGKRGHGGIIAFKHKSNADEEYRRRQEMRKELVMGIALVEGDFSDFSGKQDAKKNCVQKLLDFLLAFFNKFIILKGDTRRVESIFDKSISSYFSFYKFIVNLSNLVLAIYAYQLFSHIFYYSGNLISTCYGSFCFTFYYSFIPSEAFTYSMTFIGLIIATVAMSIIK